MDDLATELLYKDEIAEKFDPAPKHGKESTVCLFFFFCLFFCRDYSNDTL